MVVVPDKEFALTKVKGVRFNRKPARCLVTASGKGRIEVRKDSADGELLAAVDVDAVSSTLHISDVTGCAGDELCDLCFVLTGRDLRFDRWQFR